MSHRDRRRTRGEFRVACVLLALWLLPGCTGNKFDLAEVAGTVLIDGKPVRGLTLTFQPEATVNATTSVAYTDAEGRYYCQFTRHQRGAVVGRHTISINHWPPDDAPPGTVRYRIPAKYNTNSELHVDVKPGKNNFDFEVTLGNGSRR